MGNQHEVRQLRPFVVRWGAAIPVRPGCFEALLSRFDELRDYRLIPIRSTGVLEFPNLDHANVHLERAGEFLCVQSGAKMWCGYEAFIAQVAELGPSLEDALFYVADEEDFVDRFSIQDGVLDHRRVHSGYGWTLGDFPDTRLEDE